MKGEMSEIVYNVDLSIASQRFIKSLVHKENFMQYYAVLRIFGNVISKSNQDCFMYSAWRRYRDTMTRYKIKTDALH